MVINYRPDNSSLKQEMVTLTSLDNTLGTTLYTISAIIDVKKVWSL